MKTILCLIAVLLLCSATKPIKTNFDKGKFPRIKIVEKGGDIKVKVNTPDSTYSQQEILAALSKYWNIVDKDPVSTVQFVEEAPNVLVDMQRETNFSPQNPKYKVLFQERKGLEKGWGGNLTFVHAQDSSFEICQYKGIYLYGFVTIVEKDADLKVKLVKKSDNYDLYVTTNPKLDCFAGVPYSCGRWRIVEKDYDHCKFSIQFVDKDPDLTIYCEDSWEVSPYYSNSQHETAQNQEQEENTSISQRISDCKFNGIPLYGRVKVVSALADFNVKIVPALADLNVKMINTSPQSCGQWQFVDALPDFTIKYVDALPDFTIKFVDAFPGAN